MSTQSQIDRENQKRFLTKQELADIKKLLDVELQYKFLAEQVGNNTLLIPGYKFSKYKWVNMAHLLIQKLFGITRVSSGQRLAAEFGALAQLMNHVQRSAGASLFRQKGFGDDDIVNLNFLTGEVSLEEKTEKTK